MDIAPTISSIPNEAIEFAKQVAVLAGQYDIRDTTITMRMHVGRGSKLQERHDLFSMIITAHVSRIDGRGRPRLQVTVSADVTARVNIVMEPNSSD